MTTFRATVPAAPASTPRAKDPVMPPTLRAGRPRGNPVGPERGDTSARKQGGGTPRPADRTAAQGERRAPFLRGLLTGDGAGNTLTAPDPEGSEPEDHR
ncbi:hypothetical protein GCM10027300_05510 [Modestobacter lapidis]